MSKDKTTQDTEVARTAAPPRMATTGGVEWGRAERARMLKHFDSEMLCWGLGTPERRSLERLRKQVADERLPYPTPGEPKPVVRVDP